MSNDGLLMQVLVHAADIQDRDGGPLVMATLFGLFPFLIKLYADGGYQGPVFQKAVKKALKQLNVEIVKRSDQAKELRGPAQAVGRRTNVRLAQSLPPLGKGLGMPEPESTRFSHSGIHTVHGAQAWQGLHMISDGL